MEGGSMHVEDMTTQRLYWYRKQRLTHNGQATRGFLPHQMGNASEQYRQESLSCSGSIDYTNGACGLAVNTNGSGRLSSCRFDRNDRYTDRNERYPHASIDSKEPKSNQPKKDVSNLPPLDISEVIETLTTLSSEGKLGKGNASSKEDLGEDSSVKVKGWFQSFSCAIVNWKKLITDLSTVTGACCFNFNSNITLIRRLKSCDGIFGCVMKCHVFKLSSVSILVFYPRLI